MHRVKILLDAFGAGVMMHLVMKFPTQNVSSLTGAQGTGAGAFGSVSSIGLIIGVLVLGLIPGCGPP
jgi:hypothetical protein